MLTINQTGYYTVNVFLPGDGVTSDDENISVTALVTNATVDDAKLELAGDIAAVQAVVDANADLLESDVFGLAKLMTTLEAFKSAESNHFTTVVDALDSISQALSTTNGGLASKLDSIESKIDVVTTIVKKTATAKIV